MSPYRDDVGFAATGHGHIAVIEFTIFRVKGEDISLTVITWP